MSYQCASPTIQIKIRISRATSHSKTRTFRRTLTWRSSCICGPDRNSTTSSRAMTARNRRLLTCELNLQLGTMTTKPMTTKRCSRGSWRIRRRKSSTSIGKRVSSCTKLRRQIVFTSFLKIERLTTPSCRLSSKCKVSRCNMQLMGTSGCWEWRKCTKGKCTTWRESSRSKTQNTNLVWN